MPGVTQLNFGGPEFVFTNYGKYSKNHLAANFKGIWVRDWGKMPPSRASVKKLPTGLGSEIQNW